MINENEYSYKRSKIYTAIPLPNIGLWFIYAPLQRLLLSTRVDWFGLSIDEYPGILWNINAGLNYRILKYIGINLNYKYLMVTADVNNRLWNGDFYMRFHGPAFTLTGNF